MRRITVAVIWLATVWSIWLMRNAAIFKGDIVIFDDYITTIVYRSWIWITSSYKLAEGSSFVI